MASIRPYRPEDLDALYRICLLTGDAGKDASHQFDDPKLLGHVYAAPYAVLSPETVFVAEDEEGVAGYIVGPVDTFAFETQMEREWWPPLRAQYPLLPDPPSGRRDARMRAHIHRPPRTPRRISEPYPAHLHINLLPRLQGQGLGTKLIDRWLDAVRARGARGAHLGVGEANARAVGFYSAYGLKEILRTGPPYNVIFFGTAFDR
jgi:ribosomal protein S18 acetylase RimI-like enzyme